MDFACVLDKVELFLRLFKAAVSNLLISQTEMIRQVNKSTSNVLTIFSVIHSNAENIVVNRRRIWQKTCFAPTIV